MTVRIKTALATLASIMLLSACGGGGSGNNGGSTPLPAPTPDPSPGFSVSIDRAALRFSGDEGSYINSQAILGSSSGTTTATVYTGALDLGTAIDSVTQQVIGTQLKFTVQPKSSLPPGEHKGSVQLFACADEKCARHFAGSPVNVPYTITIQKGMTVSPVSLSLSAVSGATVSRDLTVQLPAGVSTFSVETSTSWLSTSSSAGSVQVKTKPLPPGTYNGFLTVSIPGRTVGVPVSYTVEADATTQTSFSSDVTSVSFKATEGAAAGKQVINVTLPSWTTELEAEIVYNGNGKSWLNLVKSSERSYTLSASAAELDAGNHSATLTLRSGYLTTPISVPVSFTVGAASWSISAPTNFTVNASTTSAAQSGSLQIDLPNLPAQGWTASSNAGWLKLVNSSGTTGTTRLQYTLDQDAMLKLPHNGSFQAEVTISSASGKIAPSKVNFKLTKALPEVHYTAPRLRSPNQAGLVILRGRGFDAVADLQKALMVSGGAQVSSITRVSDTQLNLQVGGASSGTGFSLTNALGVHTGTATVKVVAPTAYTATAVDTAGIKGGIVYDDERKSVYTTNKTLGTVMRFAHVGGEWVVSSAPLPTVESLAMSPDGASLVATATSGKIVLFDPATLTEQASYPVPAGVSRDNVFYPGGYIGGYKPNGIATLVMANNGKAIFQGSGGSPGGSMGYFDLVTRTYGNVAAPEGNFYYSSDPFPTISGDGSRLLFGYADNGAANRMQYMDTSDEVVKANGGGIGYWHTGGAQSLHGERLTNGYAVWDKSFNLIGNVTLPYGYYVRDPVFSPDGKRLYLLAYYNNSQRIFVLDTSTRLVTSTDLPVLGYIELADAPSCHGNADCYGTAPAAISPDGRTLFYVGDQKLLVVPIPATLTPAAARPPLQRAKPGSGAVPTTLVPLQLKAR